MHYAASAAVHALTRWVDGGPAPQSGPRFEFEGGQLAKDEHGNTKGGIRLPPIDVPVARYESTACQLGGFTVPFLDPQLHALYPTHAEYYEVMADRSDAAVAAGWLLPADAVDLMRRACDARVRWLGTTSCAPYPRSAPSDPSDAPGLDPPGAPTAAAAAASSAAPAGSLPATGASTPTGSWWLLAVAAAWWGRWLSRRVWCATSTGL